MTTPVYTYLQLIKTVLEEIRTANGYQTDIGAQVLLEQPQQQDDDAQRVVLLQTTYSRPTAAGMSRDYRAVGFHVVAQVSRGAADAQLRLHKAQADIDACLSNQELLRDKFQLGSPATGKPFPQLDESVIASQVEGVAWIGVALRYTAMLRVR